MKKHFLCALLFTVMALIAMRASVQAQDKTKIGIIEIAAFRSEVGELKVKYEKLQAEFATVQRDLESMATSIEAKQKTLQESGDSIPRFDLKARWPAHDPLKQRPLCSNIHLTRVE